MNRNKLWYTCNLRNPPFPWLLSDHPAKERVTSRMTIWQSNRPPIYYIWTVSTLWHADLRMDPLFVFLTCFNFWYIIPPLRLKLPYNHQREKPEVAADITCSLYSWQGEDGAAVFHPLSNDRKVWETLPSGAHVYAPPDGLCEQTTAPVLVVPTSHLHGMSIKIRSRTRRTHN